MLSTASWRWVQSGCWSNGSAGVRAAAVPAGNTNCAVIASTGAATDRAIRRLSRLGGQLVLDGGQFLLDGGLGSDRVELRLGLPPW